jgi:hypothetical protein
MHHRIKQIITKHRGTTMKIIISLLSIMIVTSCGRLKSKDEAIDTVAEGDATPDEPMPPGHTPPSNTPEGDTKEEDIVSFGIRSFEQVNATMSVLTGVPITTANIVNVYSSDLSTQLPNDNNIKSFSAANQVAITKLAVEYCDALFENATLRSQFMPGINATQTPAQVFNENNKNLIAKTFLDKFWGAGLDINPDVQADVVALMNSLLQGKAQNNAAITRGVLKGTCTAVLASGPTMML